MNVRAIVSLAYRELCTATKQIRAAVIGFAAVGTLAALVVISAKHGNVAQIFDSLFGDMPDEALLVPAAQMLETMKAVTALAGKGYASLAAGFLVTEFATRCSADERKTWQHFYRTVPVNPAEKALATYSVMIGLNLIGFLVAFLYSLLLNVLAGTSLCAADFAVMLTGLAFGDIIGVILQVGIKLLHSTDKAGIMLLVIMMVAIFGSSIYLNVFKKDKGESLDIDIWRFSETYEKLGRIVFPIAAIGIVVSLAVGYAVNFAVYKRREK